MDILKNKSYKDYNYTSRYATIPYYYNTEDSKYVYGLANQLSTSTEAIVHYLSDTDTLDSLALKYYGRPDAYWIIADYCRIQDPFIKLTDYYEYLFIPVASSIKWE